MCRDSEAQSAPLWGETAITALERFALLAGAHFFFSVNLMDAVEKSTAYTLSSAACFALYVLSVTLLDPTATGHKMLLQLFDLSEELLLLRLLLVAAEEQETETCKKILLFLFYFACMFMHAWCDLGGDASPMQIGYAFMGHIWISICVLLYRQAVEHTEKVSRRLYLAGFLFMIVWMEAMVAPS